MFWAKLLIQTVSVLYAFVAVIYIVNGDWKHALVFGGYTMANTGLLFL